MNAVTTDLGTSADTESYAHAASRKRTIYCRIVSPHQTKGLHVESAPDSWGIQIRLDDAATEIRWEGELLDLETGESEGGSEPTISYQQVVPRWNTVNSETIVQEKDEQLMHAVEYALSTAVEEDFEDGMVSSFSERLTALVLAHGIGAINALDDAMKTRAFHPVVVGEALKLIGMIDHSATYLHRRSVLERSLRNESALIRDGAALGLSSMDDPHALPSLREAVAREPVPELRDDLEQVVSQLVQTVQCHIS